MISQELVSQNLWSMAAAVLASVIFYFRPSEALSLKVCQVVPPLLHGHRCHRRWTILLHPAELGRPSKTSQWDDARNLDLADHEFFGNLLAQLIHGRGLSEAPFLFMYGDWRAAYRQVDTKLKTGGVGPADPWARRPSMG